MHPPRLSPSAGPWLLAGGLALLLALIPPGQNATGTPATGDAQDATEAPGAQDSGAGHLAGPDGWRDMACAECHWEQTEEWAESAHARAWIDEVYQAELPRMRRPARCHGCHAPQPLHVPDAEVPGGLGLIGKARVRADDRHLGIQCAACHLGPDQEMLGPHGRPTDAHATARGEAFKPGHNELCIGCHRVNVGPVIGIAKDFVAEVGGLTRSCVACHMEFVERDPPEDAGEDALPRPGRSHRLRGSSEPAFLRKAFEITVRREGESVVLRVANRAAHRLPGLREQRFVFDATSLDAAGGSLGTGRHTVDVDNWLPDGGSFSMRLPAGHSVSLTAAHHPHGGRPAIPFLAETLPLEATDGAGGGG